MRSILLGIAAVISLPAILAILAIPAIPASLLAQTRPARADSARRDYRYRYRLLGVYDDATGDPVAGVEVVDIASGLGAKTTATGTVSLLFLPDSGSVVRLRKVGYEEQLLQVPISPRDTAPVTVVLRKAVRLPTVNVTDSAISYISPQLREFEERRKRSPGGYFIDAATLRKFDDVGHFGEVLAARMPGARQMLDGSHVHIAANRPATFGDKDHPLPCADWGPSNSCLRPGSPRGCWVALFVDGVVVYSPGSVAKQDAPDFASMPVSDFAGVEYYPHNSSLPVQFSAMGSLDCGTLLLWTREK